MKVALLACVVLVVGCSVGEVAHVKPGSPADQAGIVKGDYITGTTGAYGCGKAMEIHYIHNGENKTATIHVICTGAK